ARTARPPVAPLPDTAVIARVQDRVITAKDFSEAWFDSDPQVRPQSDSLGRVEFLNSMVNKEILALVAKSVDRPLGFEDRTTLREHTNRVLTNVLYQRMVIDSIQITEQ